jgi:hypothetical protein
MDYLVDQVEVGVNMAVMELVVQETLHQYHHHKEMMVVTGMKVVTRPEVVVVQHLLVQIQLLALEETVEQELHQVSPEVLLPTLAVVEAVVFPASLLVQVAQAVVQTASTQTPEHLAQLIQQVEAVAEVGLMDLLTVLVVMVVLES